MADTYDLSFTQGETWTQDVTYIDGDGDPVNLAGWSGACQIRRTWVQEDSGPPLASVTVGLTPSTGVVSLSLSAAQTSAIPYGTWRYDVLLDDGNGVVVLLLSGTMDVKPGVTTWAS